MRILLRVAYDGTNYCGSQLQPNVNTIEGEIKKAAKSLFNEDIEIIGASRTDAGVHALGNVMVFDVDTKIPAEKISHALNSLLPEDIRIVSSKEVEADFHPRHQDCNKTYEYRIYNDLYENPKERLYSYFVRGNLDVKKMNEACRYFLGEHDFTSFCAAGSQVEVKVRTIYSLEVVKQDKIITVRINGNGFLYNMVRIIAGTLIKVGYGNIAPEEIADIIEAKNRTKAGPTAPAKGLTLIEINY